MTAPCDNFNVLPISECYEIGYKQWESFLDPYEAKDVLERTKASTFVHLWNKFTSDFRLRVNSKAAYVTLAKEFCPIVFSSLQTFF